MINATYLRHALRTLTFAGLMPFLFLTAQAAPPSTTNQKQGVTMSTNPRVKMTTSQGDIIISLDAAKAPKTVANFLA
jgi:peptidyl-prolyl cis-trans isomerase B (cyclophilin B)